MKQASKAAVRREAWRQIEDFGLPRDQYDAGEVLYWTDPSNGREEKAWPNAVVFRRKDNPEVQVIVGSIYWNEEEQEIMQVGSNYGHLEY